MQDPGSATRISRCKAAAAPTYLGTSTCRSPPPPPGTVSFLSSSSLAPPDTHACATKHDGAEWHRYPVRRCGLRSAAVVPLPIRCTGPTPSSAAPAAAEEGEASRPVPAGARLRHLHLPGLLFQPHMPYLQARLREGRPPHKASQVPRECKAISVHQVPQEIQQSVRQPTLFLSSYPPKID